MDHRVKPGGDELASVAWIERSEIRGRRCGLN
jgi:hypothetical protein